MKSRGIKSRGMTLLEVLVALSVFSIAALAVMNSTGEQIRSLTHLEKRTFADWIAENQLTQVILDTPWPELGWNNGESKFAGNTWYWRWHAMQTTDEQIRAIEMEVREEVDEGDPISVLRTYVVKP